LKNPNAFDKKFEILGNFEIEDSSYNNASYNNEEPEEVSKSEINFAGNGNNYGIFVG